MPLRQSVKAQRTDGRRNYLFDGRLRDSRAPDLNGTQRVLSRVPEITYKIERAGQSAVSLFTDERMRIELPRVVRIFASEETCSS